MIENTEVRKSNLIRRSDHLEDDINTSAFSPQTIVDAL